MFRFREVCGRPLGKKAVETLHLDTSLCICPVCGASSIASAEPMRLGACRYSIFRVCHRRSAHRCHRWKRCLSMQFLKARSGNSNRSGMAFAVWLFATTTRSSFSQSPNNRSPGTPRARESLSEVRRDDLFWMDRSPCRKDNSFSFYALPQRIHPAASRIQSPATDNRFRHGTKLLRWRPDKSPEQCKMNQLAQKKTDLLRLLK